MPRLTFTVSADTHRRLQIIPHGSRNRVLRYAVERLAELIEEAPAETIAKLLTAELTREDLTGERPS